MKITQIDYWAEEVKLKVPYRTAEEYIEKSDIVFIKAETDKGISGIGCTSPDKNITRESPEEVISKIGQFIEPLLYNSDPFRYIHILESIKKIIGKSPATLCLVDVLLYDLLAKSANIPLYKLLGGYRERITTSVTIGIIPLEETIEKTKELISRGFNIIKLKGGLNVDEDIEKVNKIREIFGTELIIRFDANQGYSVNDAIKFMSETRRAGLELFEQPTPRDKFDWLGIITRKTDVPVIADESLMDLKDAYNLSKNELTDLINIKLVKVGGITEALHINSTAKAAGIEAMVGCLDECALGISAGMHFALSRPNIAYADLDGHLDLENDPTKDAVVIKNGNLYPNEEPGLGFSFD